MTYLLTIIVFLIIFSFLVLVHELGHFVMAKRAGIKVEEFGLGLPPRIWGKKKGETIYSINWIPFGGFVRMYGENGADEKMLRSKKSFVGKPMRARVKVIVAGVVMNFFLAWILMVVGFTAGMQPLLVPDEVLEAINRGDIVLEPGMKIKSVDEGSVADLLGFKEGFKIYSFEGDTVSESVLNDIRDNPVGEYKVFNVDGDLEKIVVDQNTFDEVGQESLGLVFYDFSVFPRLKIFDLPSDSGFFESGLRAGDVILTVNGKQIYEAEDFYEIGKVNGDLDYEIYRDGKVKNFVVEREDVRQVIVSNVVPASPAFEGGIESKDIIVSINGARFSGGKELTDFIMENKDRVLTFAVLRGEKMHYFEIKPDEDGRIGVYLSDLISYGSDNEIVFYNTAFLASVTEIRNEQYPFHISLYKAFGETYKLSKFTVVMFGDFLSNLAQGGGVRGSVAGPVGIAQMTHVFVQEGFIPVLRFVAILSLSLAVINILPIPALDGGRLLFILIELIVGRRVPQKWESFIHAFGYILILALILAVTYSDIARLGLF